MLQYLETRHEIAQAQKNLEGAIRKNFSQTFVRDIGYPGGRESRARVATDGHFWFWSKHHRASSVPTPRRLNWFGVLSEKPGVGITVEINTAYTGTNNLASGFFARDSDTGAVYLFHSGRVGGGAKGVGKNSFLTWAALARHPVLEVMSAAGDIRHGLMVMPVEGNTPNNALTRYIELVRQFKLAVRNGEISANGFQRQQRKFQDYFAEGRGKRTGQTTREINYVTRHGEIVDALHEWRKARPMPKRARVVKDIFMDMGVAIGDRLIEVFEVKPQADRSSIYSALGQLLVHGHHTTCQKVMILPHDATLPTDLARAVKALKVEILRFKFGSKTTSIL